VDIGAAAAENPAEWNAIARSWLLLGFTGRLAPFPGLGYAANAAYCLDLRTTQALS